MRRSTSRACPCASSASTSRPPRARRPSGSWSVFQDAQPRKALYRKFAVRRPAGRQDDYAALAEVLSRRFARAGVPASAPDWDESFAAIPNLVVVDGGKGQLSAALKAMHEYELPRVAVVSLAKKDEHVFVPGQRRPIVLDRSSAGLQLLQRHPRRGSPLRRRLSPPEAIGGGSRLPARPPARRRPGEATGAAHALRLRRPDPRRLPGGAGGSAGPAGEDRTRGLRAAAQGGADGDELRLGSRACAEPVLIACALLALAVAACGGEQSEEAATPPDPGREVMAGARRCRGRRRRRGGMGAPLGALAAARRAVRGVRAERVP